jgi:hypothetical protein
MSTKQQQPGQPTAEEQDPAKLLLRRYKMIEEQRQRVRDYNSKAGLNP